MAVLIVTYDLNKASSSDEYQSVLSIIKAEKNWARLSESCYAMSTSMSPEAVYGRIKPYLESGDQLLVFTAMKPYFGQHSKEVVEWLGKKL